jgi:hypothetical protein
MPVIQAAGEGWDVTVITDASGGISKESHEVAIQRMIAAGTNVMTVMALAGEWQRDWARTEHVEELTEILIQHFGGSGIAYLWKQQLLNMPVPSKGDQAGMASISLRVGNGPFGGPRHLYFTGESCDGGASAEAGRFPQCGCAVRKRYR